MEKYTDIILWSSLIVFHFINNWLYEKRVAWLMKMSERYMTENDTLYRYCLEIILTQLVKDENYEEAARCKELLDFYKNERKPME